MQQETKTMKNDYLNLPQSELNAIAFHMDDDIRERLHSAMVGCHPGEFLTAYVAQEPEFADILTQFSTGTTLE